MIFMSTLLGCNCVRSSFEFYRNKLNAAVQDERNSKKNYRKEANITHGKNMKEVKFVHNDASRLEKNAQFWAAMLTPSTPSSGLRSGSDDFHNSSQKSPSSCWQLSPERRGRNGNNMFHQTTPNQKVTIM